MNTEQIINNLAAALNAANKAGVFSLTESAALAETLHHVATKLQQLDGKESNSNQPE